MRAFLLGETIEDLKAILKDLGEPGYRAGQVINHLYRNFATDYGDMHTLPAALRAKLEDVAGEYPVKIVEVTESPDGTEKLLLELNDKNLIEMVLIPSPDRMTFCLSTQAGCPVGCRFCASGAAGLARNLTCSEILAELLIGAKRHGSLPDNVVFMGIGESLLNTKELFRALEFMTAGEYIGMSPRRITVSTSGIVPGMERFAELEKEFTLAVSLHAADDETRAKIIPPAMRYPISEIMKAADRYREQAGRMVTLEYTMLAGINDSMRDADRLAELARKHHAKINLIPFNAALCGFERPSREVIEAFLKRVEEKYHNVTLRRERGGGEDAACGQLRLRKSK